MSSESRYVYDGMLVVQERNGSNVPLVSYTRGTDLSGTLQGAGGIGGLLARSHGYSSGSWTNHNMYHADGNGNVTAMVGANQALVASYRYDPYGRTTYSSGTLASANLYRFSSKPIHVNSGLYYYGYRFYSPELQRWMNRDPMEEDSGINLYLFALNCPVGLIDPLGLAELQRSKNNSQVVIVGECEIVVLVGHGDFNRPHRFLFPRNAPAAGCFIGCGADATNKKIREKRRVPGAPTGQDWEGDISSNSSEYTEAMKAIEAGVEAKAKEMLKDPKCHCGVKVIYLYAPSFDTLTDTLLPANLPEAKIIK